MAARLSEFFQRKNSMNDKTFIDTNIFVYAYTDDEKIKHFKAQQIIRDESKFKNSITSTQVLSEFYSAMTKIKIAHETIKKIIDEIISVSIVNAITVQTIEKALFLKEKYAYAWWDSLILSSALESGCAYVCSEDMQHGQAIENLLTIKNPFLAVV
jgi:predicted nucleic acid-binding protein